MPDVILYHYAMSPFSEKVRAMLGYAGLEWASVTVPEMPPRPVLEKLTGGYRKIPVAQMGADVFCDSRTIAAEIARLANKPELVLEDQPQAVRDFVSKVDLEIFLACVISASDGRLLKKLIQETSLFHALKFLADRIGMGRKAKVKAVGGKQAKQTVMAHIADLEQRLGDDFLFGASPCIADFSAYHGLWFVCDLAGKPWLRDYPKTRAWMARVQAFGHGRPHPMSAEAALAQATEAEPVAITEPGGHAWLGQTVSVAPSDYGRDPVTGTLVAASDRRFILSRQGLGSGPVHVHFPAEGFSIRKA
ncbi:MAG: glutathione S-transferase [Marinobacter sp. 34-60-7]|nr:MAG: glutathione S-transferase [Marinobacter sp. 34-60-7]